MKGFIFAAASLWELCLCFWLHTGIFPELSSWLPSALILCNIPLTRQRRQRGRCQILILLLHKTFSRWSPHSAFWWLPQSLPGPRSSDAHRSDCINMPIVCIPLCSVAPCHLQGMDHPVICLQYSEYLTPQCYELESIQCSQARHLPTANLSN